jgi:hypothetical protein
MPLVYHHIMRGLALPWLVLAACYKPSPQAGSPCNARGECPDGLTCVDNVCTENPAGMPDACPGARCDGDTLIDCDGNNVSCSLGCTENNGPHCLELAPSNGLTSELLAGANALLMSDKLSFDSSDGQIKRANLIVRHGGVDTVVDGVGFYIIDDMAVWTASAFTIPNGEQWTFTTGHPVVLYSATAIVVDGILDLGGSGSIAGPGGGNGGVNANAVPCRGGAGTAFATGFGEGGGGGGGETAGGNGAPSNQATFGIAGSQCSAPSAIPLRGGNGGGAGGFAGTLRGGPGGGGGGAIALVAMLNISVTGTIGVPGGGGITGAIGDGGGGGGSGGAIFLEAPTVLVTDGQLTANGGGGAAGRASSGSRGSLTTTVPAVGGNFNGARGGSGGAAMTAPANGANFNDGATNTISVGGGGGGAVGRILIKATSSTVTNSVVSPAAATTAADYK